MGKGMVPVVIIRARRLLSVVFVFYVAGRLLLHREIARIVIGS
jgi:hypothetical protein